MDSSTFTRDLQAMSPNDIVAVAAGLDAWQRTVHDEVAAWHATMLVDQALRRLYCARAGAAAAQRAQRAVQCAAAHAAIALPDDTVTRVARAAADVARAMLVERELPDESASLLRSWGALFPSTAA
jgi:hypothetical protein